MNILFTERLKQTRLAQGLTQRQLAEKSVMALASYSSYEIGTKKPTVDAALRIAGALNVSLDWLCGYATSNVDMKFETLADVLTTFITLDSTGLRVSIDEDAIAADADEALGSADLETLYQAHYESFDGDKSMIDSTPMSPRAIFRISDGRLARFFGKWSAIREQFHSEIIDQELYALWLEKQLSEARKIPLPFMGKQQSQHDGNSV